jgi:hypothetical protein
LHNPIYHELYVFHSVQNLGKNRLAIENNIWVAI